MKYTTKYFKEKGTKGGSTTLEKYGREYYVKMAKKREAKRRKQSKKLSTSVEIATPLDTTP